ncbi:hypothetical protein [uncultured Williamsia sp.]|uniref:hypothetical protein n=1 Tax=uncultured Williamsia sp. TaxID=259311 RepID=UPI002638DD11|nr:hypothetical protein [uncultured Williamsia sp.]
MSNRAHLPGDTASDDPRVGRIQLAALIGSIVIAAVVGTWAYFFPAQFYDHFPAVLGEWISQDGPYNEHLIRDHGAQYLALGLASVFGLFWHSQIGYRLLGIAWTTFGVLHFLYHVTHLSHLSVSDRISQVIVLGFAVLLGVGLFIPPRRRPRPA